MGPKNCAAFGIYYGSSVYYASTFMIYFLPVLPLSVLPTNLSILTSFIGKPTDGLIQNELVGDGVWLEERITRSMPLQV